MRISTGEVMEILLPIARKLHAQSVYEQAAARLRDEDQSALEPVYISHPDASDETVEENVEATPVEATHMDTPEPAQEPVHVRQTRSRSRPGRPPLVKHATRWGITTNKQLWYQTWYHHSYTESGDRAK